MKTSNEHDWIVITLNVTGMDATLIADRIRELLSTEPVEVGSPLTNTVCLQLYYQDDVEALLAQRLLTQEFPSCTNTISPCATRDWQHFWRHHFHRQDIGHHLQIVPVWESPEESGRIPILIDPGMSFGTGDHFTTRFCLEQMDELFAKDIPSAMLDAGMGSGILSVAARKLGCPRVDAFDFDPVCLDYTRRNLELNNVSSVHTFQHDITRGIPGGPYDLVVANLYSRLLIQCAESLCSVCQHRLIVTGILQEDSNAVSETFSLFGAKEIVWDGKNEWCGMVFLLN